MILYAVLPQEEDHALPKGRNLPRGKQHQNLDLDQNQKNEQPKGEQNLNQNQKNELLKEEQIQKNELLKEEQIQKNERIRGDLDLDQSQKRKHLRVHLDQRDDPFLDRDPKKRKRYHK